MIEASEIVIRPARPADLAALPAIELSADEAFARAGRPLPDGLQPTPPDRWAGALMDGLLWVAEDPNLGPIGFLAAELTEDGLYIQELAVILDRQRQGLGRRLIAAALAEAGARRLSALTLTTFRTIPWNAPFYASLGFVELAAFELSPSLAAHLRDEAARGLNDRCAMRCWI